MGKGGTLQTSTSPGRDPQGRAWFGVVGQPRDIYVRRRVWLGEIRRVASIRRAQPRTISYETEIEYCAVTWEVALTKGGRDIAEGEGRGYVFREIK